MFRVSTRFGEVVLSSKGIKNVKGGFIVFRHYHVAYHLSLLAVSLFFGTGCGMDEISLSTPGGEFAEKVSPDSG
jgi:hypothetical protein